MGNTNSKPDIEAVGPDHPHSESAAIAARVRRLLSQKRKTGRQLDEEEIRFLVEYYDRDGPETVRLQGTSQPYESIHDENFCQI